MANWHDFLDVTERVGGWLVAGAGSLAVGWRWLRNVADGINAGRGFHREFGPEAAAQIRTMLEHVCRTTDELQVRQRIAEKHLQYGVYICHPDGRCVWANEYLCEAFGLSEHEFHGFEWLRAVDPRDAKRVYEEWAFSTKHVLPYSSRYRVINKHTGETWCAMTEAYAVTRGAGESQSVAFYMGFVVKDATDCTKPPTTPANRPDSWNLADEVPPSKNTQDPE
jgi:PAS domain-containing protein